MISAFFLDDLFDFLAIYNIKDGIHFYVFKVKVFKTVIF